MGTESIFYGHLDLKKTKLFMLVFYIILPSFNLPMNAKVGITLLSMAISIGIN